MPIQEDPQDSLASLFYSKFHATERHCFKETWWTAPKKSTLNCFWSHTCPWSHTCTCVHLHIHEHTCTHTPQNDTHYVSIVPHTFLRSVKSPTFSSVQSCWEWSTSGQIFLKKWLFWLSRAGSPFPVTLAAQMASSTLKSMWEHSLSCLVLDTLPETVRDLDVQRGTVWQCGR